VNKHYEKTVVHLPGEEVRSDAEYIASEQVERFLRRAET